MMTAEERLLEMLFPSLPTKTKNIHDLTEEERKRCDNGYNCCIEIIVDDDFIVTGGTLKERCMLTDSDINMKDKLVLTTTDEILKKANEEEITLYVFEDVITVLSDIHYASNEDKTYCIPIQTDLSVFEEEGIEINDLR